MSDETARELEKISNTIKKEARWGAWQRRWERKHGSTRKPWEK